MKNPVKKYGKNLEFLSILSTCFCLTCLGDSSMGECKKLIQRRSGDDGICLSGDLWALKGKRSQFSDGGEGVRKKL